MVCGFRPGDRGNGESQIFRRTSHPPTHTGGQKDFRRLYAWVKIKKQDLEIKSVSSGRQAARWLNVQLVLQERQGVTRILTLNTKRLLLPFFLTHIPSYSAFLQVVRAFICTFVGVLAVISDCTWERDERCNMEGIPAAWLRRLWAPGSAHMADLRSCTQDQSDQSQLYWRSDCCDRHRSNGGGGGGTVAGLEQKNLFNGW